MTQWKIIDGNGDDVMSAECVTAQATRERRTPRQIAEREAKLLVNVDAGDDAVFAVPADDDDEPRGTTPGCPGFRGNC